MSLAMSRITAYLWRLGVALVLVAAAWGGWTYWRAASEPRVEARYQLEAAVTGEVVQTVTANGTVNPVGLVSVGTQVSGTVTRLYADFNDKVKAGEVLLELDPTTTQAAVEQSAGELASAEAALRLARTEEARMRELHAQEYVSRQDLDKAIQVREAAEAQLRSASGKLMRDRANLGYTVIRSPVAGVVVSREVDIGQTVAASFQTPTLFKIARDLSRMQIDSNVAEADIGKVRVGQTVRFTVDAFPERSFEGRVQQIRLAPLVQQNVVTYNVVVEVSNPDLMLMPGMTAYLRIVTDRVENALLVPNAALRFRPADDPGSGSAQSSVGQARAAGGGKRDLAAATPRVHVLRNGELSPVDVETGISDGRYTAVRSAALASGDLVVVEDLQPAPKAPVTGGRQFRLRF